MKYSAYAPASIGNVSLGFDLLGAALKPVDGSRLGDEVEIFGENLHVATIAKKINTIPYEIYSTLNRRLKRLYSDS